MSWIHGWTIIHLFHNKCYIYMHMNFEKGIKMVLLCKTGDKWKYLYLFEVNNSSSMYSWHIMCVLSFKFKRVTPFYLFIVNLWKNSIFQFFGENDFFSISFFEKSVYFTIKRPMILGKSHNRIMLVEFWRHGADITAVVNLYISKSNCTY